jgi:cell division protein FtsB
MAYMGTRFIATVEANADPAYKKALTEYAAHDTVYTNLFTGVHGNYLGPSIAAAGLDPDNLPVADKTKMNFGSGGNMKVKAWRDIWGCGQGIGQIHDAPAGRRDRGPPQGRVRRRTRRPVRRRDRADAPPAGRRVVRPATRMSAFLLRLAILALLAAPGAAAAQTGIDARFNDLQRSISALSSQIEQLKAQERQLEQQLTKMQTSFEQRIERLEKGPAARPTPKTGR